LSGRIAAKSKTIQGVTTTHAYGYDARGRLETVHTNGTLTATWGYDPNGNRISQVTGAGTTVGLVDDQDRLLAWGAASYTYDANGDLTTRTDSAGLTSYDYDLFGNLRRVDLPSGDVVEYLVDGQNRRVGRVVNGAVTHKWLYKDQLNPVAELDAAGNVVARFIYGTTYHAPDVMLKGGATYRLITDHLGSVRLVVDVATGTVAQRLDYDEWGRVLVDTNPGFQPFGFAGGLYDPATGLVRFGARDYDAEVGRWTAKDPIRFAGGDENIYAYVGGDPVNLVDPGGMWTSGWGVSLSANGLGFAGTIGVQVVTDSEGNSAVATYGGVGSGTGSPGASLTLDRTWTNAANVCSLAGPGGQQGPAGGLGGAAGAAEVVVGDGYVGGNVSGGLGTPGGSLNTIPTHTQVWPF
jgi:RHS repeat-associated protein